MQSITGRSALAEILGQLFWPTTPSALMCLVDWNWVTAVLVRGPNAPSHSMVAPAR